MRTRSTRPLGVGLLGAGPVVQAVHLPTLARLTEEFTVTRVTDINPGVAATTATSVGAASTTSVEELLSDPAVDVVAICSPAPFHADQVIGAMESGKRAILCEKPLATSRSEAERIADASRRTGVPVLVGAMHVYDPAWVAVRDVWGELPRTAHTVRSSIVLPPNGRFERWATEPSSTPPSARPPDSGAAARADKMRNAVLGLAIHDLPLVREFLPEFADLTVHDADLVDPYGYGITLSAGPRCAVLVASMHRHWAPRWELEVLSDDQRLHVEFTPSFVHAGSAVATLTHAGGRSQVFGPFERNGYEAEWRQLHALLRGDEATVPPVQTLIDDLVFAVDIAEVCAASLLAQGDAA